MFWETVSTNITKFHYYTFDFTDIFYNWFTDCNISHFSILTYCLYYKKAKWKTVLSLKSIINQSNHKFTPTVQFKNIIKNKTNRLSLLSHCLLHILPDNILVILCDVNQIIIFSIEGGGSFLWAVVERQQQINNTILIVKSVSPVPPAG